MTRDEVAEIVHGMPQGMDADDYLVELVNRAIISTAFRERERIIKANAPEIEKVNAYIKALEEPTNFTTDFVEPKASSQKEQEPVGYVTIEDISSSVRVPSIKWFKKLTEGPLYTAPPISDYHEGWEEGFKAGKREWIGLSDDEIIEVAGDSVSVGECARAIEQKLKEKNA